MACEGGHFSLFSAVCAKLFGKEKGGSIFALVYYCFGIGSVLGFVLQLYIVKVAATQSIGYIAMFMILSVTAAGSLVLLLWRFREESPWLETDDTAIPIKTLTDVSLQPSDSFTGGRRS